MFIVLIIFIFFPKLVSAQTYSLYLSEIGIEPTQQVEIINTQNTEVDISGYYLDDDSGTTFFTIPPNSKIPPNNCIVFSGNFNLNKTTPDTLRFFTNKLPPTEKNAELIDSYFYSKSPGENLSFQRDLSLDNKWEIAYSTFGLFNKTKENCLQKIISPTVTTYLTSIPTLAPTPSLTPTSTPTPTLKHFKNFKNDLETGKILISEVYANPNNLETEWIEVYNSHPYEINFSSWFLDDLEGSGGSPKQISGLIKPNEYAVFHLSTGIFNNESDYVRLLDQNLNEIDVISYQQTIKGVSYGRNIKENSWCFQLPTPYYLNANCIDAVTPSPLTTYHPPLNSPDNKIQRSTNIESQIADKLVPNINSSKIYFLASTSTNSHTLIKETDGSIEQSIKNPPKKSAWQSINYFTYLTVSIIAIAVKMKNGF